MSLHWMQKLAAGAPTETSPLEYAAAGGAAGLAAEGLGEIAARTAGKAQGKAGKKLTEEAGTYVRPGKNVAPVLEKMRAEAGDPTVRVRPSGPRWAGFYQPGEHSVQTRNHVGTALHEFGHAKRTRLAELIQGARQRLPFSANSRAMRLAVPAMGVGAGAAYGLTDDPAARSALLGGAAIAAATPAAESALMLAEEARANIRAARAARGVQELGAVPRYMAGSWGQYLGRHAPRVLAPAALAGLAYREATKTAEAEGHWRRLAQGQEGHDPSGNPIQGKTWVSRSRMREGMKPMKHQKDFTSAARQLLGRKGGGGIIAAHGTGTGKTFSAINTFEVLKGEGKAKRALVIAPAGLRVNFLKKGVEKFTGSKGVIMARPKEVGADVEYVVVSYAAFRNNPQGWIDKVKPDTIIADEVQRAGNPNSATFKALELARDQVPHFMGLTASIAQNSPADVVPLLALAEKGKQQIKSKKSFKKRYVEKKPSEQKSIFGNTTYEKTLVRQGELNARVGATIHYVEDLDASKKPTKSVEKVHVEMSPEQKKFYQMSMRGVDPTIIKKIQEGKEVSQRQAMNIFTSLMRARQVSNSLHLATPGMTLEQAAEKTPKIKRILDDAVKHINDTPDAQVIMYTNMVHGGVDVLEAGLKARGISYGIFAGKGVKGVTEQSRQAAVTDYQNKKNKVIVITGAGAEGLSLGNTTMVQLVDGHYNPERMAQAEARGIRAGGLSHRPQEERNVAVKRYVSSLPKTFWQTITFRQPSKSVGEFVYLTAERKDRLNRQLRNVLQRRSEHESRKRDSLAYRLLGGGP